MTKLNNVCRFIDFKDDMDLYHKIDEFMNYKVDHAIQCMRLKDIKLISDNRALVYLEADFSVIQVHFFIGKEMFEFEEAPCNDKFMMISELNMIDQNGEITLCGRRYGIESIDYCIDRVGISYAEVHLTTESEETDYE